MCCWREKCLSRENVSLILLVNFSCSIKAVPTVSVYKNKEHVHQALPKNYRKKQQILIPLCQQMQQRQQQESKLMGHGRSVFNNAVSPIPAEVQAMVHNVHPNHEMMMRPEAQNIMDGLRHGKLTVQHLVHQLHNQGNNPRIREMLAGVLKVHLQHQQQQARAVSPHVMPQQMRITSPMNGGDPALMHQGELCTRSTWKDRVSLVVVLLQVWFRPWEVCWERVPCHQCRAHPWRCSTQVLGDSFSAVIDYFDLARHCWFQLVIFLYALYA